MCLQMFCKQSRDRDGRHRGAYSRRRPSFGFGFAFRAEIGKKFSFGPVSFSVGHATASFGFSRNCQ